MSNLVALLRQVAKETIVAGGPADFLYGVVVSTNPLEIQIEQKEILPAQYFQLTRNVLDHYVDIEVSHVTEKRGGGSGMAEYQSHDHDYKGRKKIMIYNGLHVGESVILIQKQGGQDFIVLDRVFDHRVSGQWLGGS